MKKVLSFCLAVAVPTLGMAQGHLLITEVVVTPTNGEYIEIYNGTGATVDLTNYYIADNIFNNDNDYINIVNNSDTGFSSDFVAKFPNGATIPNNTYQIIAMNNNFSTQYGFNPTYELTPSGAGDADAIPDMLNAGAGGIGSTPGLSNDGEVVILFYWDGQSDLVKDVDYVVWGDKVEAVDKTGVKRDGPDAGTDSTTYANDTSVANQKALPVTGTALHAIGNSVQRSDPPVEVGETTSGGNGITGHDETSEDLPAAFVEAPVTPGAPLPVELSSFTALPLENAIELRWTTATESNNLGFDVERSTDGQAFAKITFVKGFGTTAVPHSYRYVDERLSPGTYYYRLKQIDTDGTFEFSKTVEAVVGLPLAYALRPNYPNPFNPTTVIPFAMARSGPVVVKVFNVAGQAVATLVNQTLDAGFHEVKFNASSLPGGIYFYQVRAGDFSAVGKMVFLP